MLSTRYANASYATLIKPCAETADWGSYDPILRRSKAAHTDFC